MTTRRRIQRVVAALGLLLGSATCGASQVTVSTPFSSLVPIASWVPVSIVGNFADSILLSSFTVTYDPAIFSVVEAIVDPLFTEVWTPPVTIDNTAGTITATDLTSFWGAPVNTDFTFLYISGYLIGEGTFDLTLNNVQMYDILGNPLVAGTDFTVVSTTISAVTATITTVPLPAGLWLFGSGLLALIGFGRRRSRYGKSLLLQ